MNCEDLTPVYAIVGPTAVGKTRVAIELAKRMNGEIVSADSRQIYKYLDIGTAKPTLQERAEVNFHLIDFLEPDENYSCGQFARDAEQLISEILKKSKTPIVCGGTGLYIRALFNPLHPLPRADKSLKNYLRNLLEKNGIAFLYQQLKKVDPEWAEKIGPNDKQRILRGLEVYEITKKPLSSLIRSERSKSRYTPVYIGIAVLREQLYNRINERYDQMIQDGLIEEVKKILEMGFAPDCYGLRTIGYKEIIEYLQGRWDLGTAIEKAKQHTRNFAKRQLTWFSKITNTHWFSPYELDKIMNFVEQSMQDNFKA